MGLKSETNFFCLICLSAKKWKPLLISFVFY